MIRITDAVRTIIQEDAFAIEAMQRNLLNLSAYAHEILAKVEVLTMKPVKHGSIVVSLARISYEIEGQPLAPHITIDSFSVSSALQAINYRRTHTLDKDLDKGEISPAENQFFTLTKGVHEVTIICSESIVEQIKSYFIDQPIAQMEDLVAVSVRFSEDYIAIPNTIYSLVGALALRHINILEIVSTYTELTFIVHNDELEVTIKALQTYNLS